MSIILKYSITESDDAKSFDLTDLTGVYDANTNIGGWGAPNPIISSVTASNITISQLLDPATSEYTTAVNISPFPFVPNITETPYTITAETVGYGTDSKFPDAVYQITLSVTSSSGIINPVTTYRGFYKQLDCCIKKLSDKVAICTCNCDGLEKQLREVMVWRRLLSAANCCGNISAIFKFIEKITRICSSSNCNC